MDSRVRQHADGHLVGDGHDATSALPRAASGPGAGTVGFLEGASVATAMAVRLFSGILADWTGNRKMLTVVGYGLGALVRPVFPLASTAAWLIAARLVDRVGKGIRAAPRDALLADIAPPHLRGASFGLRKSLDTIGGFVGPLIAMLVLYATSNSFTTVFWLATAPALLSVLLLVVCGQEPARRTAASPKPSFHLRDAALLTSGVWTVIALAAFLAFARFSEAFLLLRAQGIGISVTWAPAVIVGLNVIHSLTAYPIGALSDKLGRKRMLFAGLVRLSVADLLFAGSTEVLGLALGIVLWGLHMGFTQGTLTAMIADSAPPHFRGAAFGVFSLITGVSALAGNSAAGFLWDTYGPPATFHASAGAALVAAGCMVLANVRIAEKTQ